MNNNDVFETRDLVLASYLKYKNINLKSGYNKDNSSWVFENPKKCEELSLSLKNNQASIEPLQYESCRRNLLGMVHDKRD